MSVYEIVILSGMFAVTFGVRYVLIGFSSKVRLSSSFKKALEFVPPAVLTAIILPGILMPDGSGFDFSLANAYLPAALSSLLCQIIFKKLLFTIVAGIAVFFLWKFAF